MSPSESSAAAATRRAKPLLHYKDLHLATQSRKVKFTCVHASENFLACGTNVGSVYLYATTVARSGTSKYHLVKVITPPSNDRIGVACVSICPLQKHLVVGTLRGVVYGLQLSDYNKIGEKVEFSHDFHTGFPVTCFLWDRLGSRLFSACNGGLVCQTVLRAGMSAIFGSADTELLLKEETGVVQLDMAKYGRADVLLVSSQLRVLLLNLTSSDGSAIQIGTKARQGSYGACFFTQYDDDAIDPSKQQEGRVFSARPGRRVWIADPQTGTVASTIKFSLSKSPSVFRESPACALEEGIQPRDLTINQLSLFQFLQEPSFVSEAAKARATRLVSWNVGSSVLFFLDPIAVEIVEWHLDLGIIHDLKILNDSTLVVLHGDAPKVSTIQSCSARQFLDLYGANDVRTSIQLAIEFSMNDAAVLTALQTEWTAHVSEREADPDDAALSDALDALVESAKLLEEQHLSATELEASKSQSQPLQVIFKHRPQAPSTTALSSSLEPPVSIEDKSVTLAPGTSLHKHVEYGDALAPAGVQAYSKSIYTPDGSTIEASMVDIPELPRHAAVVRDADRLAYLDEVFEDVKRFEQSKSDDQLLAGLNLKGNSIAAAKAISTLLPSTSLLTSFMDPSALSHHLGRTQVASVFGDFPSLDDAIVLDPDPRTLRRSYTRSAMTPETSHEYSVLRIAMSSKGDVAADGDLDTEVLLEAISMDIWDTNLKYTSNLPLSQQLGLPAPQDNGDGDDGDASHAPRNRPALSCTAKQPDTAAATAPSALSVSVSAPEQRPPTRTKAEVIRDLKLQPPASRQTGPPQLERRNTVSPNPALAAQRALQRFIGATPSCDITRKCMVGGRLARAPELESVRKREVVELSAELQSAAATAEKTRALAQRLWPAAGITRSCACLTSLYLFQGDLAQVQSTIKLWLSCFDPTAEAVEQGLRPSSPGKTARKSPRASGFARGEALVDGDGLPLTRGDWNLVRVMVSVYFAIGVAGDRLHVRPVRSDSAQAIDATGARGKLYAQEMGIALDLDARASPHPQSRSGDAGGSGDANRDTAATANEMLAAPQLWSPAETEAFVHKYGAYLNPELAAEVCTLRRFSDALNLVLDRAVSSPEMSNACDEIVDAVAEQAIPRALAALRERDSLVILLHLLDVLLKKCRGDAIELCVAKYPVVDPWNVERSLFGAQIAWHDAASGALGHTERVSQTATYFEYLARLLEAQSDVAGRDADLVHQCLTLCFRGNKVVGTFFDEHDRESLATWVAAIVRRPETFAYDHAACWTLFTTHHVVSGLLELTLQSLAHAATRPRGLRELHDLVALIVQHKHLRELERVLERLAKLDARDVVETTLLQVLAQLEASVAAERHSDAVSATAIYALLNAVPLPYGMALLARYRLLFAATPLAMYHTIVEHHVLTRRQVAEVAHMLEGVDTHVWSTSKDASAAASVSFAPQLAAILELELGTLRSGVDAASAARWHAKCRQYDDEVREHAAREGRSAPRRRRSSSSSSSSDGARAASGHSARALACRTFEYRNSDWGGEVQLHDATCAVCELPVVIIADAHTNLDVVLLPCGHAFHSTCLDDHACAICLDASLETLAWSHE